MPNCRGGNGNGLEMEILEMEMWKWKWSKRQNISISGHLSCFVKKSINVGVPHFLSAHLEKITLPHVLRRTQTK